MQNSSMQSPTAFSSKKESQTAAEELAAQLAGSNLKAIVFFAGLSHEGAVIGQFLEAKFPGTAVVGCSTNGEFSDHGQSEGGAVAIGLTDGQVRRCAGALAETGNGTEVGVQAATDALASAIGSPLRDLDSERYVGLCLLDGANAQEEAINIVLGDVAPALSFVGGSAGDNVTFAGTWVYAAGKLSRNGVALLLLETCGPYSVVKTCNAKPTQTQLLVTKSEGRIVREFDGQPAASRFAEAIGGDPKTLGLADFVTNPLGLMIDGEPWLRCGFQVVDETSLFFACELLEGMRLSVMELTDLTVNLEAALDAAREAVGGDFSGAVFFNCAYRKVYALQTDSTAAYHRKLSSFPHAGFHTNGESLLGHINQTLTGIVFGPSS